MKKHRSLSLLLAVMLVFVVLTGFRPLVAEAGENTQGAQETSTKDVVILNGLAIWTGEIPQDEFIPLTPVAWALGYYIQVKSPDESYVHVLKQGELPETPVDNYIFITTDPGNLEPYDSPITVVLGQGYIRGFKPVATETVPILQEGELYLSVDDMLDTFDSEITIDGRVITMTSADFNPKSSSEWTPRGYSFDEWFELVEMHRDEEGMRRETFYEPITNTELFYARLSEFATLSEGQGLAKPVTVEQKLNLAAQVVANSDPESGFTEISISELIRSADQFFGPANYDLSVLPETWPMPDAKELVAIQDAEYVTDDNLNYAITYVNPVTGMTEVAYADLSINSKSLTRPVTLALDEIVVVSE